MIIKFKCLDAFLEWDSISGKVRTDSFPEWFGEYTEKGLNMHGWKRCKPRQLENK